MDKIFKEIMDDEENKTYTDKGIEPLYAAPKTAKIVIVGQAPGIIAQETKIYWNDRSGIRLREWLDVDNDTFYNSGLFGIIPMDFYYPGKGKSGDLPPRNGFADKWHQKILKTMPNVELIILVGQYAQKHYLGKESKKTLTETVRSFEEYLPNYFPLVHPSPRNQIWMKKNSWFQNQVIPTLQKRVAEILKNLEKQSLKSF
ncbi:uracil-DNA glycosylase family protein [Streptococcus parauberis]|uniref:uracil-DNA glycosylase family protein n=1 Tax=Streptococcus parauberis TaxID=1348 RepID=UPI000CCFC47B|nr:uracil-DNA glycosylase family protein [Streptococcus parauberis]PNY19572.1 Uracil DNA glycosylase superfamily protein [Streptococcus parauberis]